MSVPTAKLPGSYDEDRKFHGNRRAARLIRQHGGKVVMYRNLPEEAQLAPAQYMSIDGEAWELAPGLEDAMSDHWRKFPNPAERHGKAATKAWGKTLARYLPFYVAEYGDFDFGYIESIPVLALIESCMDDNGLKEDYGLNGWENYHEWYMQAGGGPKHAATSDKPWPVILSSFPDETLDDGWTRFHQYAQQKRETCPAVWFPRQQSRRGAAIYNKRG